MCFNYEKSHPYFNNFRLKLAAQELVRMALELYSFKFACQCHALIGCNTGERLVEELFIIQLLFGITLGIIMIWFIPFWFMVSFRCVRHGLKLIELF